MGYLGQISYRAYQWVFRGTESEGIGFVQPKNACADAPAIARQWGTQSYTGHTGTEASGGGGCLSVRKWPGRADLRALPLPAAGNGVLTFVAEEPSEEVAEVWKPLMVLVLVVTLPQVTMQSQFA